MRSTWLTLAALAATACSGGNADDKGEGTDDTGLESPDTDTGTTTDTDDTVIDTGTQVTDLPPPDYSAWGAYAVGTDEAIIPGPDGIELVVQVWYPSADSQGDQVRYDGLWEGLATEGLDADCSETRPVLVFSHGLGGTRWQSAFFVEHLASHGYVVVSPDHLYNTLFDLDLRVLDENALRRPADVSASFDALADLSVVSDCVDTSAGFAVAGHSFGGYTALAVAGAEVNDPVNGGQVNLGDDRVWATIGLAPWDGYGAITQGTADIEVPTMILTGQGDLTTPIFQVRGLWSPLTVSERYFGIFDNAGHYSFSPSACLLETTDGCGPNDIPPDEFNPLVNQAAGAFLDSVRVDPSRIELLPEASDELSWEME